MDEGRRRRYDRKERVLHTRISEQLSEDIRRLAEDLRVPTSNLVRNVLEEVFAVVENVSDDVGELFEDVIEEAESARQRIRRRRRHHGRRRRYGGSEDTETSSWADLAEAELRADEQAEHASPNAASTAGGPAPAPPEGTGVGPTTSDADVADAPSSSAGPARERPGFPEVVGWQPLVMNHTQDCADCARTIPRGSRAFVGLTERGLSRITLCRSCLLRR